MAGVPVIQLSVIVPTYNERERLGELVDLILDTYRRAGIRGEVVIVDDNSPDGTGELAQRMADEREGVKAVRRPGKLGLGSAAMDGFRAAAGDMLGVMDADFSHPPALLPRMFQVMVEDDADFVVASRYVEGGSTAGWPFRRWLMSRAACLIARPLTPVRDATSGFFMVRRRAISGTGISAQGFKILLELLVRGEGRSVIEVPYMFSERLAGASKMNTREAVGYLGQVWRLLRFRSSPARRHSRPAYGTRRA
jgi:dolichol-phosphate mannosyltransferase